MSLRSAIMQSDKHAGQLAQLVSGFGVFFRLVTLASKLGAAATLVVLGRPRMALQCLREVA